MTNVQVSRSSTGLCGSGFTRECCSESTDAFAGKPAPTGGCVVLGIVDDQQIPTPMAGIKELPYARYSLGLAAWEKPHC